MWLRSVVMIVATVFTATVQSQPAGLWALSEHKEQIKGPSERAAPNCNWRGDSGDRGYAIPHELHVHDRQRNSGDRRRGQRGASHRVRTPAPG